MVERDPQTRCPECERLEARVSALEAELAAARKNSGTSSKPPSSDIVKPPKDNTHRKKNRKCGGQKGHPRHDRPPFTQEQIDDTHDYALDCCPDCGGQLEDAEAAPRVIQQIEIVEKPVVIEEHRGLPYWCANCRQIHYGPLPAAVSEAGLIGPRLTALVAYLKGGCHASFSTIRKFLRDVIGVTISRGQLAKLVQKVSASLKQTYEELLAALPDAERLNVDETGHPDQGRRFWTWCFRASLFTLYRIDPSRGSDVLIDVLGKEFDGVLGCDYFSAYRKYMKDFNVAVQFCLAHLIRDVKFLVQHPHEDNRRYGQVLLDHLRKLFGIIHRRDSYKTEAGFRQALEAVQGDFVYDVFFHLADTREADNLAKRFVKHIDSYFRFITTPGVEPTNNLAEQAIRFVAIHRRLTQGTRGEAGQRWCERIWTTITTCTQQGRSVFNFLCEAVAANFRGAPAPSLLPNTS